MLNTNYRHIVGNVSQIQKIVVKPGFCNDKCKKNRSRKYGSLRHTLQSRDCILRLGNAKASADTKHIYAGKTHILPKFLFKVTHKMPSIEARCCGPETLNNRTLFPVFGTQCRVGSFLFQETFEVGGVFEDLFLTSGR